MSTGENGETKAQDVSKKDDVTEVVETVVEASKAKQEASVDESAAVDDFGLPTRSRRPRRWSDQDEVSTNGEEPAEAETFEDAREKPMDDTNIAPQANEPIAAPSTEPEKATLDDIAARRASEASTDRIRQASISESSRPGTSHDIPSPSHIRTEAGVSEWSHQQLTSQPDMIEEDKDEGEWQQMPAFATHRIYDDWGKVLAKEYGEEDDEQVAHGKLGGAGKGYTRVQVDDDAESATSMDDNTAYLFKDPHIGNALDEDEEGRDLLSQMQATKELLTEGQRIAYVGVVRLSIGGMLHDINRLPKVKNTKKQVEYATEAMKMWGQKIMVRLYGHMEIDSAEQIMVEQLAEHGVLPADLTSALMQNARVKNPAKVESERSSMHSARPSMSSPRPSSTHVKRESSQNPSISQPVSRSPTPPPAYEGHNADELTVEDPAQLEIAQNLDIDIRWTVLCDLFLVLIADSTYDSRSRTLLEFVGDALSVPWQEVGRFEKRVTDALEMQEQAERENWNEDEHMEARKKAAKKRRLVVMGLCTVGGGLVIGLSAGVLAPLIGAGLAAGATTVFGATAASTTFLTGAGTFAAIGTAGTLTGGFIGVRASDRRTGAVKTFEYRPLFNNKRTNLVVTVAGWMTGNVDDVRLPFSTVDPIMGDVYSINWEPDMLRSVGQTIQILGTEALTQTIQQVLGATILGGLMSALSAPIILAKLSYLIDNPWTVSLARADAAGLIFADSIIDRNLGSRPITLVGYSLGSRLIFSALKELARRGALGLVQDVYLFGSPIVAKKEEYMRARTVVSGRFVNGYATNDWILGYLFRATSGGIMRVSGLASVEGVPGIENKDVTETVPGHMAYRAKMPTLLQDCGWLVDSLEFTEIEDPDPDNHEKRQRELINEIEAARYVLEQDGKVGKQSRFKSFFSRKKAPEKKSWETYDERSQKVLEGDDKEAEKMAAENENVMFDVDAIRQEALKLALQGDDIEEIKKYMQVREIESTMPALKIASPNASSTAVNTNGTATPPPKEALRQTRSYDETTREIANAESSMPNGYVNGEPNGIPSYARHNRTASNSESRQLSQGPSREPSPSKLPERPPLKSASTAPTPGPSKESFSPPPDPNYNPWGDEDDPEFGKEKNVQLSFD